MVNETLVTIDKSIDYVEILFSKVVTRFVVAAIILLMGFIIGKIAGRLLEKILHEIEVDNLAAKTMNLKISLEQIMSKAVTGFIYFIAIIMALGQLGLATTALNLMAAAVMLFIIISMIISIKDVMPNIFAGIVIQSKRFIREGDYVKIGQVQGKIINMNLIETRVETDSDDIISIPNSNVIKSEVVRIKNKTNKS